MGYTINDNDTRHNGWTNYATWRVNLEVFDGMNLRDHFEQLPELNELASWAEGYADELLDAAMSEPVGIRKRMLTPCDIVSGWASAFLAEVNWHEIAAHLADAAKELDAA
jgi:hypothetical protein